MDIQNLHFKLAPYVLKRYESSVGNGLYLFYNAKNRTFWEADYSTGSIVALLDGSFMFFEIIDVITKNNPKLEATEIEKTLTAVFEFLYQEEFILDVG